METSPRNCLLPIILAAALAACCAPDKCRPARVGFRHLEPVIDDLLAYGQQNGRYPRDLHELYPSGLPEGLVDESEMSQEEFLAFIGPSNKTNMGSYVPIGTSKNAIGDGRGKATVFFYSSASDSGYLSDAEKRSGAYRGHYDLDFSYTPPGINHCLWTTKEQRWNCSSYY